ncbi:MAG: CopG family transcriptional regulator [Anaerolineae bacterium]|nr:CopG family transcriptional regulator [Anaerolineae bacterium]
MKRTTIMMKEELLYEIKQIAQRENSSMADVIREALTSYVVEKHQQHPPENPLLGLVGLGESAEPTDIANGGDEALLKEAIDPVRGWSVSHDGTG